MIEAWRDAVLAPGVLTLLCRSVACAHSTHAARTALSRSQKCARGRQAPRTPQPTRLHLHLPQARLALPDGLLRVLQLSVQRRALLLRAGHTRIHTSHSHMVRLMEDDRPTRQNQGGRDAHPRLLQLLPKLLKLLAGGARRLHVPLLLHVALRSTRTTHRDNLKRGAPCRAPHDVRTTDALGGQSVASRPQLTVILARRA